MSYNYRDERSFVFTEEGQVTFLKIRDNAKRLIKEAGAATMERIIAGNTGNSWSMLACVDRLVELKEVVEIPNTVYRAGQFRIFTIVEPL